MPQPSDPALDAYENKLQENSTVTAILRRLIPFVDPEKDLPLTSAMDLINAIYPRVRLEHDVREVEEGTSWDYCKQTAIDWLNKVRRWIPVHRAAWDYQMGCVPPVFWDKGLFMTGEAYSGPFHLTFFNPRGERYYCCLLKHSQVLDRAFFDKIPFADELPMLGFHDKKEVAK